MDSDGRNLRQLTSAPAGFYRFDQHPTWAPNGKRIAFTSSQSGGSIVSIGLDGRGRHVITDINAGDLSWSPDGRHFAFSIPDPSTDSNYARLVMIMTAAGGSAHTIAKGKEPDWSPDGRQIVFVHVETDNSGNEETSLHVVNANGSQEHALPGTNGFYAPHYSPDGRFIVASSSEDAIVILDPNSGAIVRTIPVTGSAGQGTLQTSWQPLRP